MKNLLLKIKRLSPVLFYCGAAHFTLFIIMLAAQLVDHRQLLGIDVWTKPAKFAISIAVYCLSWPLMLQYLPFQKVKRRFANFTAFALSLEMLCIGSQAARGQLSHFNTHGAYNFVVYVIMGVFILLQTLFAIYIGVMFFKVKAREISNSVLWGIRLGTLMAGFFAFEGGFMAAHSSHTIGAADGTKGLPVFNWSSIAGDLRIAHFMGLHALQIIPLFAVFISPKNTKATLTFSIAYFLLVSGLFINAMLGRPL